MATSGKDTGGSQFFICLSEQPHLNRHYTVFGQVVKGGEIIDIIEIDDIIKQMTLIK
jgi:peptidyl-prolyl cis-trans isomerase B (cyclophilin B)